MIHALSEREIVRLSQDIQGILDGWEYEPDGLQVRLITGDDGKNKIQMRIDLGLIQMALDGRPDGQRPDGFASLLDAYEEKAKAALAKGTPFSLSAADCAMLMREGMQYYHRYLSAFHLKRYDIVERDTDRNLRLFAFVTSHAARQRDKIEFDQYRPYVHMMRARAAPRRRSRKTTIGRRSSELTRGSRRFADSLPSINKKRANRNARSFNLSFAGGARSSVSNRWGRSRSWSTSSSFPSSSKTMKRPRGFATRSAGSRKATPGRRSWAGGPRRNGW